MSNRVSQNLDTSQAKNPNDSDPFHDPPAAQLDNEVVPSYGSQAATGADPQSGNVEPDDAEVVTTQPVDPPYQLDNTALQPPVPFVISERSSLSAFGTNDLGASKESQPLASAIVPTLLAGDSAKVFGERPEDLQLQKKRPRKFIWLLVSVAVVVLIFLAVFLPVFFVVVKKSSAAASGSGGSTGSGKPTKGSPSGANAIVSFFWLLKDLC
jgi:glucan 1,3-beta-glucosidase